jgi:hypothetical protein
VRNEYRKIATGALFAMDDTFCVHIEASQLHAMGGGGRPLHRHAVLTQHVMLSSINTRVCTYNPALHTSIIM